jgi:N-acetylglucosaminyldiphosphoundecaprenol N-acetyl-beta-D-mannosaminyltransferase
MHNLERPGGDTAPALDQADPVPAAPPEPIATAADTGADTGAGTGPVAPTPRPEYDTATVMGVPLVSCSMDEMVQLVESWVDAGEFASATGVNGNVVNLAARDARVRRLLEANTVNYVDGQSVVWASRLLGLPVTERVATTDLIYPLAQMCARRDFGLFFLGGRPEIVQRAAERLAAGYPGLRIDVHHGYFGADDDPAVVKAINDSGARVLLVGMGDPRQQQWVHEHLGHVSPQVLLTCGGLFDWVSGANPRPPRWMVERGLEWLWRIRIEPRRLLRRYLVGNPEFLARLGLALGKQRVGEALARRRAS